MHRPPLPLFTKETALIKVRAAEDTWDTHNPDKVLEAYALNSNWRNRTEFLQGRDEIKIFS